MKVRLLRYGMSVGLLAFAVCPAMAQVADPVNTICGAVAFDFCPQPPVAPPPFPDPEGRIERAQQRERMTQPSLAPPPPHHARVRHRHSARRAAHASSMTAE